MRRCTRRPSAAARRRRRAAACRRASPSSMSSLWANSWSTTSRPSRGFAASRRAARHDDHQRAVAVVGLAVDGARGVRRARRVTGPAMWRVGVIDPVAHDDRADAVVPRLVEAEDEQHGVGGDDGAHLVGELEAAGRLPALGRAAASRPARRGASRSAASSSRHCAERAARISRQPSGSPGRAWRRRSGTAADSIRPHGRIRDGIGHETPGSVGVRRWRRCACRRPSGPRR